MRINFFVLIIFGLLTLTSCEDDPSSVGQGLLEDQDIAKFYSIDSNENNLAIETKSYLSEIQYGSSKRTLVGNADNLTVNGLIKFVYLTPDSVEDAIDNNQLTVEESYLNLPIDYSFGNMNATNVFSLNRITNDWSTVNFDRKSLENITFGNTDLGSSYNYTDSSITIVFDQQTSFEWLSNSADTNKFFNYGMLLKPVLNSERIIGFNALSSIVNANELPSLKTIVRFESGDTDTLEAVLTADAFAVEGEMPPSVDDQSLLQGGLPVRTDIKFDLSSIPKTAVVIDAKLTLQYDSLNSVFGSSVSDTLLLSLLNEYNSSEVDSTLFSLRLTRDANAYSGDIEPFIQLWTDERENEGLQIRLSDEDRAVSKVALYNEKNDTALKPHLKIIYTDIK